MTEEDPILAGLLLVVETLDAGQELVKVLTKLLGAVESWHRLAK